MRNTISSICVGLASAFLASGVAHAGGGIAFNDFNVVTLGNLITNQDVEGTVFVGGNLGGGANQMVSNDPTHYAPSYNTVNVAGNIDSGTQVHVEQGSVMLGGTNNGTILYNGGGSLHTGSLSGELNMLTNQLNGAVTAYSALTANSTVTVPGSQPGPLTFNAVANSQGVAVFDISSSLFSNTKVQQVNLNLGAGVKDIVINVSGGGAIDSTFNWTGFANDPAIQSKTIWNFENATSINAATEFYGAVLAPDATLTGTSPFQGSVFVKSVNTNGEIHLPYFDGYIPSIVVPEPPAAVLASLGGIGIACYTWVRRNRAHRAS